MQVSGCAREGRYIMSCDGNQKNDPQLTRALMDWGQKLLDCGDRVVIYHVHDATTAQSMKLKWIQIHLQRQKSANEPTGESGPMTEWHKQVR